jgi:hypothetical protein
VKLSERDFYLKARFATVQQAAAAMPRLRELLRQGEAAYLYWQDLRPGAHGSQAGRQPANAETFWAGFRQRFPLVHRYLRELADTPDWNNGLAGQLSCMAVSLDPPQSKPFAALVHEGVLLLLKLCDIWHLAEMGRLERYCREDLGAVAVGSMSEDDLDWDEGEEELGPPDDEFVFYLIDV